MKSFSKKINTRQTIRNRGFTLIETLVAITILMISIVGPLTIASKGLTAAVTSKDQVIASYLAQDTLEYLKNVRDNDLLADSTNGWTNFFSALSAHNCATVGSYCSIETAPSGTQGNISTCTSMTVCHLYIDTTNGYYTYAVTTNTTEFNRSFTVTRESAAGVPDAALVTVTVTWKNGTVTDQVVLNDMLFNTLR